MSIYVSIQGAVTLEMFFASTKEKLTTEEVIKLHDEAAEREKQLRQAGEWEKQMTERPF